MASVWHQRVAAADWDVVAADMNDVGGVVGRPDTPWSVHGPLRSALHRWLGLPRRRLNTG